MIAGKGVTCDSLVALIPLGGRRRLRRSPRTGATPCPPLYRDATKCDEHSKQIRGWQMEGTGGSRSPLFCVIVPLDRTKRKLSSLRC
jgi:hypothetical protein